MCLSYYIVHNGMSSPAFYFIIFGPLCNRGLRYQRFLRAYYSLACLSHSPAPNNKEIFLPTNPLIIDTYSIEPLIAINGLESPNPIIQVAGVFVTHAHTWMAVCLSHHNPSLLRRLINHVLSLSLSRMNGWMDERPSY